MHQSRRAQPSAARGTPGSQRSAKDYRMYGTEVEMQPYKNRGESGVESNFLSLRRPTENSAGKKGPMEEPHPPELWRHIEKERDSENDSLVQSQPFCNLLFR